MKKFIKNAKLDIVDSILHIILYALIVVSIPCKAIASLLPIDIVGLDMLIEFIIKISACILPIIIIFKLGYGNIIKVHNFKKFIIGLILILPAILIAINNFPIQPLIIGSAKITASQREIVFYILMCMGVGCIEEVVFRGVIFPLVIEKHHQNKTDLIKAIIIQALIFGSMHIVNITSQGLFVFAQIGYSFLIGAMCGMVLVVTKNLLVPILIHAVYNIGGLMVSTLGEGVIWNEFTITLTAIFSVIVIIYFCLLLQSVNEKEFYQTLNIKQEK